MHRSVKKLMLTLTFTSLSAGISPLTWAEGGYGHNQHHDHGYKNDHGYKHNHGYGNGHYYKYHHDYGHYSYPRHHYADNHQRRYNSDDDELLVYGLLAGGLLGYVIGHNQPTTSPAPEYVPAPSSYVQQISTPSCLQEREYQMTVMVGGQEAQAYGTACLQPDGSWYRGPATVVSR